MKVVILAGGLGTRLSEETGIRPKPMVEIGGLPILWHIMKIYSHYGFNEFVILLGYKGQYIKEFFANYYLHAPEIKIDVAKNQITSSTQLRENWSITLLDTGESTLTGGRIKRAAHLLKDEPFMLTYGDGVADVNIEALLETHRKHGKICTMTTVQPEGRFGMVEFDANKKVTRFLEKPKESQSWINGGFFICEPSILDYIENDMTIFENTPMTRLAEEGQIFAYCHKGFWKCMDTLRDKTDLNEMWNKKEAKWKIW